MLGDNKQSVSSVAYWENINSLSHGEMRFLIGASNSLDDDGGGVEDDALRYDANATSDVDGSETSDSDYDDEDIFSAEVGL